MESFQLPPLPPLDRGVLRADCCEGNGCGPQAALRPVHAPYLCENEHAPHLLLIAGMGLDGYGLIRQAPLGACTHLHLFQMPNHPAQGEEHLARFARHVEEYIHAKKLDESPGGLVLGGNSMGGATSLLIAQRKRVKLRGLALVGTFGHHKHLPFLQRIAAPLAWVVPMGFGHVVACRAAGMLRLFGQNNAEWTWIAHPEIRRTFGYYGRAVHALTTLDLIPGARELSVPTLVIHGRRDRILRYAAGVELAETIPNARFVTIDDAGHNLFFTHPKEVNGALAHFLDELPTRGD